MRTTTRLATNEKTICHTELLVSLRTVAEFHAIDRTSVRWIDVKEPARGALGRPDLDMTVAIYNAVAASSDSERFFSVALGELSESIDSELANYCDSLPRDVYFKIALADCDGASDWQSRVTRLAGRLCDPSQLILVHYADAEKADAPSWDEVFQLSRDLDGSFILVDTWEKKGVTLLDLCSTQLIRHMVAHSHAMGMRIALAGSLRMEQLPELAESGADWIGLRSALCQNRDRTAELNPSLTQTAMNILLESNKLLAPRMVTEHVIR